MIRTPLEIPIQLRTGVSANSAQLVRQKDGDFSVWAPAALQKAARA
jgi:hypothetical protein